MVFFYCCWCAPRNCLNSARCCVSAISIRHGCRIAKIVEKQIEIDVGGAKHDFTIKVKVFSFCFLFFIRNNFFFKQRIHRLTTLCDNWINNNNKMRFKVRWTSQLLYPNLNSPFFKKFHLNWRLQEETKKE
jgi:hypothetical protein